jgi:hypothetical protein
MALRRRAQPGEFIVTRSIHGHAARVRSYELLAGLPQPAPGHDSISADRT